MRTKHWLTLVATMATGPTWAVQVDCYENPRTNAMQCVSQAEVRATAAGIRHAPLYMGGPNQVRKTDFTIHTNCTSGVTHLKDREGVSFAGGDGTETPGLRRLREIMCNAHLKKK